MKTIKPKFTMKKKTDNKTLAAYILLAFFVFVFIGSVLGIIAFARTSKDRQVLNVVSANADVVDDFQSQRSLNLVIHDRVPLSSSYHTFQSYYLNEYFNYVYSLYCKDIPTFREDDHIDIAPLSYFYPNYASDNVFMAFTLDLPDSTLDDFPCFSIGIEYDGIGIEYFQFRRQLLGTQCLYSLDWDFYNDQHVDAYLCADYESFDFGTWGDTILFYNLQFKSLRPYYNGYAYTIQELRTQYEREIEQAFNDGLVNTDGYQTGYDDGYQSALNNLDIALNGALYESTCDLRILRGNELIIAEDGIDNKNTQRNGFSISAQLAYWLNDYEIPFDTSMTFGFTFRDFTFDIPLLSYYLFNFSFTSDMESYTATNIGLNMRIDTDRGSYYADFTKVNDFTFTAFIDTSAAPSNAEIIGIVISGYATPMWNTGCTVSTQDGRYNLGYETGYWNAYDKFEQDYHVYLNEQYELGFKAGETNAYDKGYNDGAEDANNYTFTSLIGSVVDVPIKAFTGLFNFEILGINLANFFFALLTMCIVLALIKFII